MRNLRFAFLPLAMTVVLWSDSAQAINDSAGTTGFSFLKVGVGARASGLGAFTAIRGDVEAPGWNPAGLHGLSARTASLAYTSYLVDTEAGRISFALPGSQRSYGFSINYFSYGDLARTDADGQDLGTFGATDLAASLTATQSLFDGRLTAGGSIKSIHSSIDDFSAAAVAIDLGVILAGPVEGMAIGASIANLGSVYSGYTDGFDDSLPVLLRAGISHRPAHFPVPLLLVADFTIPNDNDAYATFGAEIDLGNGLSIRPGYSLQQGGSAGDEALGLSAGGGLAMQRYRIDYAYSSFPDLGDVHRISLSGHL
ncbi:MAG: PorV/PorQ family protein [Gemmatimonadetes bacterium]|jgi:hypothetical protein|nr:PorV/PorQ family protein [Gemmatimonadota bacterium]MBT4610490.1 PorV/PorQ family protein [Gemmatimonadota bacterium]MBT5141761.1 PorV/PorQ family protein [Gemmatimonadota bacterium]MBT5591064.1 PorV/PorQ family protein [Gemmatimonadota bacterium]MBT5962870.1 PorV/PorQ family protein [Gemmatimonadota bacterium]